MGSTVHAWKDIRQGEEITHDSVLARLRIGGVQEKPRTIHSLQSIIYQDDKIDGSL
jgi:hypothetical protein